MGIPESDVGEMYVDVLMKVHGNIGKFKYGRAAKLTTWIFSIARNTAVDHHRACKKNIASEELDDTVRHSEGLDGAFAGRNTELLKWLDQELLKLPEQDQLLLKWRAMDFSYAQIGEWLGMKEGTARVRYQRVMEKLLTAAKSVRSEEGAVPQ